MHEDSPTPNRILRRHRIPCRPRDRPYSASMGTPANERRASSRPKYYNITIDAQERSFLNIRHRSFAHMVRSLARWCIPWATSSTLPEVQPDATPFLGIAHWALPLTGRRIGLSCLCRRAASNTAPPLPLSVIRCPRRKRPAQNRYEATRHPTSRGRSQPS